MNNSREAKRIAARDRIDVIAAERGITRICEYVNTGTKTQWRCVVGHEWSAPPSSIQQGSGCPHCSGRLGAKERTDAIAAERGITRIGDYINALTKTQWKCSVGHVWSAKANDIQQGSSCPHCSGYLGAKERIDAIAAKRGITRISEYINSNTKVTWKCSVGHISSIRPNEVQQGAGCAECLGRHKAKDRADAAAALRGIIRIDEYTNNRTKVTWRCADGHEWFATPNDIQQGSGCPTCSGRTGAKERIDAIAAERGVKRTGEYVTALTKTQWECKCGHEWLATPGDIQQMRGCPECAQYGYHPARPGTLYVLISECGGKVKIGITGKPQTRIRALSTTTPFIFSTLQIHTDEDGRVAQNIEREAHQMLSQYNAGLTGFAGCTEWFHATRPVLEFIALL